MKIQFIWCGKIWEIILSSVLKYWISKDDIYVVTSSKESADLISKKYQVNIWENINSDFLFLAIKPQQINDINLKQYVNKNLLIVSILAWTNIEKIFSKASTSKIIRCMPNLPVSVWKWVIWYFSSDEVSSDDKKIFMNIFSNLWEIIKLDSEDMIDKITALSGSGPAYFYYFTELLKQKAMSMGFSKTESEKIANNTFLWSALYFDGSNKSIEELKDQVTSKWGTTERALKTFEENWLKDILEKWIDGAYERARELSE